MKHFLNFCHFVYRHSVRSNSYRDIFRVIGLGIEIYY